MKLDQLLQREDFVSIFIATLSDYFRSSKQWEGDIHWGLHGDHDDINLIVYSRLNLIYPISIPTEQLVPLVAEYAYHINPLRHWAQKLYISVTLAPFFRRFFSRTKLHITKKSNLPCEICILPGNHTIRVVDLHLDECVVIKKKGFSASKLANTVSARLAYPDMPGPKIIDSNIADGWYLEERIFGLPTNRLESVERINKSLSATKTFLMKMYNDTTISEKSFTYIDKKFKAIDAAIDSLPVCYEDSDLDYIKETKSRLVEISDSVLKENCVVQISQTHGDLQAANLLVPTYESTRDVYIIDWEYAGKRCCHYDWFVYGLRSRAPNGLASRIEFLLKCDSLTRSKIDWYDFSKESFSRVKVLVVLFLIEDFLFRLDDTSLPNLSEIPIGFLSFIEEVRIISNFDFD